MGFRITTWNGELLCCCPQLMLCLTLSSERHQVCMLLLAASAHAQFILRNPFGYHPWSVNRTYQVFALASSISLSRCRQAVTDSLQAMFDTLEADIVVMQECKIQRKDLQDDMVLIPGWDVHFSLPKVKKGETPSTLPDLHDSADSVTQGIPVSPYTQGAQSAVQYVLKKVSQAFSAPRT